MKLETLIAFHEELSALTRSGTPLGLGLLHLRTGLRGELERIARDVGDRLQRGESIAQVFDAAEFPSWYAAVVNAGIASNNLPHVLSSVSSVLRRQAELRRCIFGAMTYPLFVVCLSAVLFSLLFQTLYREWNAFAKGEFASLSGRSHTLLRAADHLAPWLPWLALLIVGLTALLWVMTGRRGLRRSSCHRLIPGIDAVLRNSRTALFLDVLSTLIEANVPLSRALPLAAAATGDDPLRREASELHQQLTSGQVVEVPSKETRGIPPLVLWSLRNDHQESQWKYSLRRLADTYFQRMQWQDRMLRQYFPSAAVLVVGGSVVAAFALLLVVPWFRLLQHVALTLPP